MVCYQNYRRSKETFFISQWSWTFLFNDSRYLCFEFDQNKRQTYIYVSMFLLSTITFSVKSKNPLPDYAINFKNSHVSDTAWTTLQNPSTVPTSFSRVYCVLKKKKKKNAEERKKNGLNLACARDVDIVITRRLWPYKSTVCASIYALARTCTRVMCEYVCGCVCGVSSFIRSLRDAQVFYNVATGARVPVSYLRPSHFSTRYVVSKSREKVSVVRPSLSNFHGKTIASNPERTRP